jgi:stage III sporulation protein AB
VEAINDMMTGLKLLESTMMYTYDPIPGALINVSKKMRGAPKHFFQEVGEEIASGYASDFHTLWSQTAQRVLGGSAMQEKEIQIVKDFGAGFGMTDAANQKSLFFHTNQLLELQLDEAMSDKSQKPKVYQSIGTAAGILIVILLL